MYSGMTPTALEWQKKIRKFVNDELIPWEVHAEKNYGELPKEIANKHRDLAISLGLPGMGVTKEIGGLGLSMFEQMIIWEQLGRVTNALCWCFSEAQDWMEENFNDYQKEHYLQPLLKGTKKECYAITEKGAGSDVEGSIETTAEKKDDKYIINGEKWYVTSANLADFFFLQAKIKSGKNKDKHSLFIIDKEVKGIELIDTPQFSHTYAHHHSIYRFNNVEISEKNIIGNEGIGMDYTHSWFRHERLGIAARCCGAAERLIDEVTAFAKERESFGDKISNYQAIQFMLADSVNELASTRLMLYEICKAHDLKQDVKILHGKSSMIKLLASEMANRIADRAVQIFGGRGYMRENVAERYFRELRVDRIWEGTSEIHRIIIANSLYKRGLKSLIE
jgi:alkylation response protein AidB-like acyl-CoA dehydrogenase